MTIYLLLAIVGSTMACYSFTHQKPWVLNAMWLANVLCNLFLGIRYHANRVIKAMAQPGAEASE